MLKIARERLISILDAMRGKTIAVIGDLMLDEYIWGVVDRISPEAPVPVVDIKEETFRLGGAGNVAKNLTSLGACVHICSIVGIDRPRDIIMDMLKEQGIATSGVLADPSRRTIVKTRVIAQTQQVVRIDKENRDMIQDEARAALLSSLREVLPGTSAVIISDYGKGVVSRELIDSIVTQAAPHGILGSVDPKERNFPHYKGVGLITPNTKELSFGAGLSIQNEDDIRQAASRIFDMLDCGMVLVTRGASGMSLFQDRATHTHIPTAARQVFDVTGAGDTVIACFTLAHIAGATPVEAAVIANCAAGIVVGEIGAASVAWEELRARCMEEIAV